FQLTVVYLISARCRRQCMRARRFDIARHSISGQYHMEEHQRCNRFVAVYIPYQVLSFLLTFAMGVVLVFQVHERDPRKYLLFHSLLYLTIAPRVMLSMLIPLTQHPVLYQQFRQILQCERRNLSPERLTACVVDARYVVIHSTSGKQLTFEPEREADIYFATYAAAW
ncbi:hypothetical protein PFISCL1PPCAC_13964, partial [Pristionchus fissidentatus]